MVRFSGWISKQSEERAVKWIDIAPIIVAIIGATSTVLVGWWAYRRGARRCEHNDLFRHPFFGRLKYLREIVVPRLNVGHTGKTLCTRKFLAIKIEIFEVGMRAWISDPDRMRAGDIASHITNLVREYEDRALRAGVPRVFVERFADHHMPVVDSTVQSLERIADSELYSDTERQAAALYILLYAFELTVASAEAAIGSLNGQLERALDEKEGSQT